MKGQVSYEKNGNGQIVAIICIFDNQDYPCINIFQNMTDYPSNSQFELGESNSNQIRKTFYSSEGAKEWAYQQIQALREALIAWRNIEVPNVEEVEV